MNPGTPFSLLLIAVGAVLIWGVQDNVDAVNLPAVGAILIGVGAFGLVMSLIFWSTLFPRTRVVSGHTHEDVYTSEPPRTYVVDRRPGASVRHDTVDHVDDPGYHPHG